LRARIAIIGLGPWGLCALERLVTTASLGLFPDLTLELEVVEPGVPGSGVYDLEQPDYLLMNNPCEQIALYPFPDSEYQPPYAVGLDEWVRRENYRWVDGELRRGSEGAAVGPDHYMPRRVMGEYLAWFYRTLVDSAPAGVTIHHHQSTAIDISAGEDGGELVRLASGEALPVDHVIITSGHTANRARIRAEAAPRELDPYPVDRYVDTLPAGASVAVAGLGLVAIDVVTALTSGRGGRFVETGGRLHYVPSGREPSMIYMYSRGGLPFTGKSVTGLDRTDVYQPAIATAGAFAALRRTAGGERPAVNVRARLLPLLFAEMDVRYYAQVAYQKSGLAAAREVRALLAAAWRDGRYAQARAELADHYGAFDVDAAFFGSSLQPSTADQYEGAIRKMLQDDLNAAEVPDGHSPVKCAAEVMRIFRDPIRSVVEDGGLDPDSFCDFNGRIRGRINRLIAGPPALRTRQFLALMDAGLLRIPFGPAPAVTSRPGTGTGTGTGTVQGARISSTKLAEPFSAEVDYVIRGHLELPRLADTASPLLQALRKHGRITELRYGETAVGSVNLTRDSHPIAADGQAQERLWVFGVLTEGVRHFTYYVPSPHSRIRAVEEIGECVTRILDEASTAPAGAALTGA
jgi:hypothetical protein